VAGVAVGLPDVGVPPPAAEAVFGAALPLAVTYARWLAGPGVERGLLGPREAARVWDRHLLNCAVVGTVLAPGDRVVDVGSGAGLPGIPMALVRTDCSFVLLEPLARRAAFLAEVVDALGLGAQVRVVRARAEEAAATGETYDVAVARAVAPLDRLAAWCLPLLRPGGRLLALKGDRAEAEMAAAPTLQASVVRVGDNFLDPPTTLVTMTRHPASAGGRASGRPVREAFADSPEGLVTPL
jgi:16S rRNA (guanine527-N7)-methyltransferase